MSNVRVARNNFYFQKKTILKITIVTSRDYIFYFSQWYATVLLIFAPNFLDERVLVRDVEHTSGIAQ